MWRQSPPPPPPSSSSTNRTRQNSARSVSSKAIEYHLAPFGRLPYGHEIWGELFFESSAGCAPFQLSQSLRESEFSVFMVIRAGGCNIQLKTLNAEKAGAHLVLILAENDAEADGLIAATHSSGQINSEIPTLVVVRTELAPLQAKYLKSKEILLKFQMPIPRSDHVTVDFYVLPSDVRLLAFIRSFGDYASKFEDDLRTHVYFLKSGDTNDATFDQMTRVVNCLNAAVVYDIIGNYGDFCANKSVLTTQCLQDQIDAVENKYIAEARRCVQRNDPLPYLSQTNLHNANGPFKKSYVYVNGRAFFGSLKPENLFEAVCGGFTHAPAYCVYLNNKYTPNTHYHTVRLNARKTRLITVLINIVLALFLLLVAAISMYLIYEKLYKQLLEVRTAEIVRQSVIDYESIKNNE